MKGLVLAAGKGTRLYPMTKMICKPLLPVYDKPLIYYPISVLLQAGITDIMVIIPEGEEETFEKLLGDGSAWGVHISYAVQKVPRGIADAFLVAEEFIKGESVCLVLGDNIFYGNGLGNMLKSAAKRAEEGRASVFGFYVNDPERFGVVEFDENYKALSLEEKPKNPKSNYAVTGLYFYPSGVSEMAKKVKPSARGELEITTLNQMYLERDLLDCDIMGRGFSWLDTGTMDSLMQAAGFIQTIQNMQGIIVASPEEIAYRYGMIDKEQLLISAEKYVKSPYGHHLRMVADGKMPR